MRKIWKYLIVLSLVLCLFATGCNFNVDDPTYGGVVGEGNAEIGDVYKDYEANKTPSGEQFDHEGNYTAPELTINGLGDDAQWQAITRPLATFGHGNAATVKAYRGNDALFFLFEVEDAILLTEGNSNDDSVTRSDSIEFYIDTLANGGSKPQSDDYQINLGIHGKTRIMQGSGSGWGNWNGLIDYEVTLDGTLNDGNDANDVGYIVEVMIPYAQINIEKNDTIAVSFGQVDKFSDAGSTPMTHWDWYGWDYGGIREPQTPDNYVLLDKDNKLIDRELEEKPAADIAGYVLDSVSQTAIAGASVVVEGNGKQYNLTTDDQGFFLLEKVDSGFTYSVIVNKEGYLGNSVSYTRSELRAVNGGRVLKDILITSEEMVEKTQIVGTVKNLVNGAVAGANVLIEGTLLSAVADENGAFSIEGVPMEEDKDVTLVVTANGYAQSKTYVKSTELVANGETALGDVNIHLPYATAAGSNGFGLKSEKFADSSLRIGRGLNGIEFLLSGTRKLTGHIEIYLDTKESSTEHRDNETSLWLFMLDDAGKITGNHYKGGSFSLTGLEYNLFYNDTTGYEARLFVPYEYLGITPLEVFGISLGQWSTSANDWDGWGYAGQFIAPEYSAQYVRVSATNEFYRQESNLSMVTLSGNTGVAGVRVTAGGNAVTTGSDGAWSFKIETTSEEVVISYSCLGYVTAETVLEAGYFDTNYSFYEAIEMQKQYSTIKGVVKDSVTGYGIEGVSVALGGSALIVYTNENGEYVIEDVWTKNNVTLTYECSDYATQAHTITSSELSASAEVVKDIELVSNVQVQYIQLAGAVSNVNGVVAGASVSVQNYPQLVAITNENGEFTIENVPAGDHNIVISKDGYVDTTVALAKESISEDATDHNLGSIDLMLNYAKLPGLIADKASTFAKWTGYVTRSNVGFEFKFVGANAFAGRIELFVDIKTSAADMARDLTDYLFNLNADGSIQIVNWGDGEKNETVPANMILTVINADSAPEVRFTLPYAFFGQVNAEHAVTSTEVIGISVGQWSSTANDWDGWDCFSLIGASNTEFVKPEMPQDYVRISAHNTLYAKADNVAVDFTSYNMVFGTGMMTTQTSASVAAGALGNAGLNADHFHAKVASRDASGVTFEFITTSNFSTNSITGEKEMILIYFDTGSESLDGWNPDLLIKVFSDGTVYARAGAWWSATDSDKLASSATITTENGVTKIVYTVDYATLGITATDVFGIALREASHNAIDHMLYDPWHDFYFNGEEIGRDAAACTQFVRVSANGTLYVDNNNNPND